MRQLLEILCNLRSRDWWYFFRLLLSDHHLLNYLFMWLLVISIRISYVKRQKEGGNGQLVILVTKASAAEHRATIVRYVKLINCAFARTIRGSKIVLSRKLPGWCRFTCRDDRWNDGWQAGLSWRSQPYLCESQSSVTACPLEGYYLFLPIPNFEISCELPLFWSSFNWDNS